MLESLRNESDDPYSVSPTEVCTLGMGAVGVHTHNENGPSSNSGDDDTNKRVYEKTLQFVPSATGLLTLMGAQGTYGETSDVVEAIASQTEYGVLVWAVNPVKTKSLLRYDFGIKTQNT